MVSAITSPGLDDVISFAPRRKETNPHSSLAGLPASVFPV